MSLIEGLTFLLCQLAIYFTVAITAQVLRGLDGVMRRLVCGRSRWAAIDEVRHDLQ
ncbi:hypothetical protein [Mycobacterium simulans]|uniref:hypothetical protein n=1 Tax=Mycobacterium simulans TaxID=627089 RepID=UPI001C92AC4E|nr:hypothetical protein [Mycobacterium simulans]